MNAPVDHRSVVSAVAIAVIALLLTYACPAIVTTYKGLNQLETPVINA